jgi:hypothetical protein
VCAHVAPPTRAVGRSSSPLEGSCTVLSIVPSRPMTRQVLRRPTTRRCLKLCVVFALPAGALLLLQAAVVPSFGVWFRWAGYILAACAGVAASAAVVYRFTEIPREVTVRVPWLGPRRPRVMHLK